MESWGSSKSLGTVPPNFSMQIFCSVATGNQTNEENADQEFTDQNFKMQ